MRVLNLPGLETPNRRDRWFAERLQFATVGQKLILELNVAGDVAIGQLDIPTGHWEPATDFYPGECPQRAWRQDYSCVVCSAYEDDAGRVAIRVDNPLEMHGHPPINRNILTGVGVGAVGANVFSPDGRWLYGAEQSVIGSIVQTAIARAEVQPLFSKPVLQMSKINRLAGQSYLCRGVEPGSTSQFATLPSGVVVATMCVSPDGHVIAAGATTGDAHLIRVPDGASLGVFKRTHRKTTRNTSVWRLAFSPPGNELGVVCGNKLRVWHVKTAELMWDLEDAKAHVLDLAYHPAGTMLAVARSDGAAVFLDALSGKVLHRYAWKVGQLNSVAFSPDGLTCAAGGERGQVVVWDVDV